MTSFWCVTGGLVRRPAGRLVMALGRLVGGRERRLGKLLERRRQRRLVRLRFLRIEIPDWTESAELRQIWSRLLRIGGHRGLWRR